MLTGIVIGFTGILAIFYNYIGQLHNNQFLLGVVLALLSTLTWAFGTVYTAKQKLSIYILFNVGFQMLIGGSVMLVVCFITGKYVNLTETGYATWYALLYLVIFGSLVAYSAYVFAISKLPATLVSMYAYINPVVAVALGWLLLQEQLNANMIFGTLITLSGIYLVNREFKKQRT
jgi:drug/metabolite transporter (DMT)-like permease